MVDFSQAGGDGANAQIINLLQGINQQLGQIAKAVSTSAIPTVTTATTAGSATTLYLNLTVNGVSYKLGPLLNP